jgi:hypothetical protein
VTIPISGVWIRRATPIYARRHELAGLLVQEAFKRDPHRGDLYCSWRERQADQDSLDDWLREWSFPLAVVG